jgi:creatinine amidohydrolase
MSVLMAELTWTEYEACIRQGAVVLLPVGATEQHGPHLPLTVDCLLPTEIARRVALKTGALVAPTVNYGYKSQPKMGGGNHFIGTTSLSASTLCGLLRDVIGELARHGVRKLAVINGHYENQMFTIEGIDLAMIDQRMLGVDDLKILRLEYWDFTSPETISKLFPEGFPGFALEHAAVIETSLMMHAFPNLVRADLIPDDAPARFPPYDVYPTRREWVPPSGVLSPAHGASAEKGKLLMENFVADIAAALRIEFAL